MKEPSRNSIDYYLLPNKILCGMLGLWPLDENSSTANRVFSYIRWILAFTAVSSIFVPQLLIITITWGDLRILAGQGSLMTTVGQVLFRMIYLAAKKDEAYRLYKELRSLWHTSDLPQEKHYCIQLAYWARNFTIIFCCMSMGTVTSLIVPRAYDYFETISTINGSSNTRQLPLEVWYGADVTASPCFEFVFVCQSISSSLCAIGISGLDMSCVTSVLHTTGQLKLIKIWINNIGMELNCRSASRWHDYLPKLEAELIRLVNDVNDILTPIIFMQLLFNGMMICLSVYAITFNGTTSELFQFSIYLSAITVQLVLWCFPCEILMQESMEIGHALYMNVPWYRLPSTYQREFLLIIVRSQRSCGIKAVTFQALSYRTITDVFNTAASFFALLRQIQDK